MQHPPLRRCGRTRRSPSKQAGREGEGKEHVLSAWMIRMGLKGNKSRAIGGQQATGWASAHLQPVVLCWARAKRLEGRVGRRLVGRPPPPACAGLARRRRRLSREREVLIGVPARVVRTEPEGARCRRRRQPHELGHDPVHAQGTALGRVRAQQTGERPPRGRAPDELELRRRRRDGAHHRGLRKEGGGACERMSAGEQSSKQKKKKKKKNLVACERERDAQPRARLLVGQVCEELRVRGRRERPQLRRGG
ncbi:hypothetical protein T492DRAFT_94787 [Pavlovales sp. CCMP2436]|nr:hypothetical protein T492DRAFT_94787 [Pavlovales sp. CCMP2436]